MVTKSFDYVVKFRSITLSDGSVVKLPLVTVVFVKADGSRVTLPLLFDTGASVTTLRHDLYPLFGVNSWDAGVERQTLTAGGAAAVSVYEYQGRLEAFGKTVSCPIHLAVLPTNPLYVGLLGRHTIFAEFGFGFWESTAELYVSTTT